MVTGDTGNGWRHKSETYGDDATSDAPTRQDRVQRSLIILVPAKVSLRPLVIVPYVLVSYVPWGIDGSGETVWSSERDPATHRAHR